MSSRTRHLLAALIMEILSIVSPLNGSCSRRLTTYLAPMIFPVYLRGGPNTERRL
jgi:hypothetical protein